MSVSGGRTVTTARAEGTLTAAVEAEFASRRRELTGYCYRMLGSGFDAEDAVQETMVRAWRSIEGFEGRASLRSWLYRIATNVCMDMLRGRQHRSMPMDLRPAASADTPIGAGLPEQVWITPMADSRVVPDDGDPAELAALRDSVRLAFIAVLQLLPPRQRAVLILRDVLRWQAGEVARLLETSVAAVNSALQRARLTLEQADVDAEERQHPADSRQQELLGRYVDAFERYDIDTLVGLLHEDATFTMPPHELWLRGTPDIRGWYLGQGIGCRGSRLVATEANGCAAFGSYKRDPAGGYHPFALQVIELSGDRIARLHHFLDQRLFGAFGLPDHLSE